MNVEKIVTKSETKKLDFTKITPLSIEEFRSLKDKIPPTKEKIGILPDCWWLRSPGDDAFRAAIVYGTYNHADATGFNVDGEYGVRPALCISNLESLQVGDKFELAKHHWTIISDKYALCDDIIGESPFRKNYKAKNANDYEASDVKQYLETWAKEHNLEFSKEPDDDLEDDLEG